jgi:hypothetical protein
MNAEPFATLVIVVLGRHEGSSYRRGVLKPAAAAAHLTFAAKKLPVDAGLLAP